MARKSRKYQYAVFDQALHLNTVGYIRLSVSDTSESHSIENQKLIIEQWGEQHQIPIVHFLLMIDIAEQVLSARSSSECSGISKAGRSTRSFAKT